MKKITPSLLIFMVFSMILVQAVSATDLKAVADRGMQGKISGQQLVLILPDGKEIQAEDGVYRVEGGTKITVQKGRIIDIEILSPGIKNSIFRIIDIPI